MSDTRNRSTLSDGLSRRHSPWSHHTWVVPDSGLGRRYTERCSARVSACRFLPPSPQNSPHERRPRVQAVLHSLSFISQRPTIPRPLTTITRLCERAILARRSLRRYLLVCRRAGDRRVKRAEMYAGPDSPGRGAPLVDRRCSLHDGPGTRDPAVPEHRHGATIDTHTPGTRS